MSKRKIEYNPQPECSLCGGTHYGSTSCPFACTRCKVKTDKCDAVDCPRNARWAVERADAEERRKPLRCETTFTMRYPVHCKCGATPSGIGPCVHWEPENNAVVKGRCSYCDHIEACHHKAAAWLEEHQTGVTIDSTAKR